MLSRHFPRLLSPLRSRVRPAKALSHRISPVPGRTFAAQSEADDQIERLQEQYATAKDEFEIASEESAKKSIYAADDRDAARDELAALKDMYQRALDQSDASTRDEIKRRVGQRVRELDAAVNSMFKKAEFGETEVNFADKPEATWKGPSN